MELSQIVVGQDLVLATNRSDVGFVPCQHNSQHSPAHPCRGKVLAVDKTKGVLLEGSGGPDWVRPSALWPVDEAKILYRASLEEFRATRTDQFIEECVQSL